MVYNLESLNFTNNKDHQK